MFPPAAPGALGRPLTSASARSTFLQRPGHMLSHVRRAAAAAGAAPGRRPARTFITAQ
jgi:hypothetical protein